MGGIGGGQEQSQSEDSVWSGQSPYLQDLFARGQSQANNFQPNDQVAGGAMQAWQQQLQPEVNPYLNDMTQQFRDQLGQANQQSGGQAGLAGGYGGGRHGVANHLNQQSYQSNVGNFLGQQTDMGLQQQGQAVGQGAGVLGLQGYQQGAGALRDFSNLVGGPTVLNQNDSSAWNANANVGGK
jgi:hypothetical protein